MNDIIEQCARAGNDAYATHGQAGHLRTARLPDKAAQAFTRAVLAKFKELTAEPTPAMIEAMQNAIINGRDIQTAATEQMWKDIL